MNRRAFLKTLGIVVTVAAVPELVEGIVFQPLHKVGDFKAWGSKYLPSGWIPCDGRTLSVRDYPDLFVEIGNNYGYEVGWDGRSENFNMPNFCGNVIRTTNEVREPISLSVNYIMKAIA